MAKSHNKTKPTSQTPRAYLATVTPEQRRKDGLRLLKFFNDVTGLRPKMWGPSIIGYGRYHYKYDSGREGEFFLTGFSPRKTALTIYVMPGYRDMAAKLRRLGPHKTGKSCLYIKAFDDVNSDVLEEIILDGLAYMRANYQTWDK